ncbi:MAG: ROK family protein [Endomicrobia bacterium]|nr:ROK family protein [Endomicrobiia bacterium]MCL2799054.1 ROK family protein [Endomicrobiia bacterium]
MSKQQFYLGIDMGGTHIKIAIVDSSCNIVEETVLDTDIKATPIDVIKSIISKASEMKNYSKVKSIGIGMAGDINCFDGSVRFSPNLPKWKNIALKKIIENLTKKKTIVDNDANTASIGAFWLDAKGKAENLVCVTLGTGVGGGFILDKKLYRGSSCSAGEIGHITIDPCGDVCKCGNRGCVETFIGAKYISKYAARYLKKNKSELINKLTNGDYSKVTPRILYLAAKKGDKAAISIWKYVGEKLGILFAGILNFINPDVIVLCGGVSHAGKYLIDPARREMKSRAFASAVKNCSIVVSKYTNKLGVVGAAMLPKQ